MEGRHFFARIFALSIFNSVYVFVVVDADGVVAVCDKLFIFADPPYALKDLESIPTRIFEKGILKEDGLLVLEHGKENHFEDDPHFIERRVYGSVNFSFFRAKVQKDE